MNIRTYMKKEKIDSLNNTTEEILARFSKNKFSKPKFFAGSILCIVLCSIIGITHSVKQLGSLGSGEEFINLANAPLSAASAKRDLISIPSGTVKANPFLPYRNINKSSSVTDVPTFDLVEPPEVINENSDAARVMDTIVSGILYDKYSPSAIINIEGNDYLVKKGDVVNNYKILDIVRDSVTVKLGANTYKAGIGEILTEGTVNHNDVSNLSKKFGGEKR